MQIKIENPAAGMNPTCSVKRALRYVKSGRAEFVRGGVLRFRGEHHANLAANQHHTCGGYDRSARGGAVASDKQMAGVPIVKPRELIAPRGRLVPRPKFMRAADVNGTR